MTIGLYAQSTDEKALASRERRCEIRLLQLKVFSTLQNTEQLFISADAVISAPPPSFNVLIVTGTSAVFETSL